MLPGSWLDHRAVMAPPYHMIPSLPPPPISLAKADWSTSRHIIQLRGGALGGGGRFCPKPALEDSFAKYA